MLRGIAAVDALNRTVGSVLRWGVLVIPLVTVAYAAVRKATAWGHNGFTEVQWFLYAWIYLGCAGYALLRGEHVRVEVLAERWPWRIRSRVEIAMHVLLWPALAYMAWHYWHFWTASAGSRDGPEDVLSGLQRWPLKLAMFAGFFLLLLQSAAEALRHAAMLRGWLPAPAR